MSAGRLDRGTPATDCPWFWVGIFATAALLALVVAGPRFSHRQAQIERRFQARERAGQTVGGREGVRGLVTPGRTTVRLGPLFVLLGLAVAVSWCLFAWRRVHSAPDLPPTGHPEGFK
jgi:hypothetical protein